MVLFVFAQGLGVLHAAEYGVGEHEHHGQLCEIYLHAEKNHFADVGGNISLSFSSTYDEPSQILGLSFTPSNKHSLSEARAPPVIS